MYRGRPPLYPHRATRRAALILYRGIPIFGSTLIVLAIGALPGFSDQFGALTGEVLDFVSGASGTAVKGACGIGFRDSAGIGTGGSGLLCAELIGVGVRVDVRSCLLVAPFTGCDFGLIFNTSTK